MKHIKGSGVKISQPTAIAIGNFDGFHMGHRQLISAVLGIAETSVYRSAVLTFHPHPMFVLNNKKENNGLIYAYDEKLYLVEKMGIDIYIEYSFDKQFAAITPEDFVFKILKDDLSCKALVVGENYHFGKNAAGNQDTLKKLGAEAAIDVTFVPSVMYEGQRVSSTRIRDCLVKKDLLLANTLLKENYFILGTVMEGKKIGRKLGFPTINIKAENCKLFPPNGVYATRTLYNGKVYDGVTNIGYNPTVSGKEKGIETNLFDFYQVVYGEKIKTHFYKFLRAEKKFDSVDQLRETIQNDVKNARLFFESKELNEYPETFNK